VSGCDEPPQIVAATAAAATAAAATVEKNAIERHRASP
jgi:hypothetical protein